MSAVAAAVLAVWFALSLANQFSGLHVMDRVRRNLPSGLLPSWALFTTDADHIDVVVLVRGRFPDGRFSAWERVPTGGRKGTFDLVDPDRRIRIAVSSTRYWMLAHLRQGRTRLRGHLPYELLRRYAERSRPAGTTGCQFLIATRAPRPGADLVPLLVSPFHEGPQAAPEPGVSPAASRSS